VSTIFFKIIHRCKGDRLEFVNQWYKESQQINHKNNDLQFLC